MIIQHSLAAILSDHVTLALESIDRMYLNVYVPKLQTEAGVVCFFKKHRGALFASSKIGFSANPPLLDVQRLSHDCFVGHEALQKAQEPKVEANQRTSGLRFGDFKTHVLLQALLIFPYRSLGRGHGRVLPRLSSRRMKLDTNRTGSVNLEV